MRGRRLDNRLVIQRRTEARDAMNAPVEDGWEGFLACRCKHYPAPGTEKYGLDTTQATLPSIFEIRSSDKAKEITPEFRIIFAGKVYGIKSVDQPTRGANIRLTAVADI